MPKSQNFFKTTVRSVREGAWTGFSDGSDGLRQLIPREGGLTKKRYVVKEGISNLHHIRNSSKQSSEASERISRSDFGGRGRNGAGLPETVEGGCQHLANPSEPEKQLQAGDVWPWRNDLHGKRLAGIQFEAGKKWGGTHTHEFLPPYPPGWDCY
jgi:hypothetical protein